MMELLGIVFRQIEIILKDSTALRFNEECLIKSFYINDFIKHTSLHKQRLGNPLKRFQFDEKV